MKNIIRAYRIIAPEKNTSAIYFWLTVAVVVSLPLSPFTSSISQILLGLYWIFSGDYQAKLARFKERKGIFWLTSIFLLHLVALLWTDDYQYAMNDLRIKLPLLFAPLFIGTMPSFSRREIIIIFSFQAAAILVSMSVSVAFYAGWMYEKIEDTRRLSRFISHIRLSLLIDFVIFSFLYFISGRHGRVEKWHKWAAAMVIVLLTSYLILLKSLTGIIVFAVLLALFCLFLAFSTHNKLHKYLLLLLFAVISATPFAYIYSRYQHFYNFPSLDISKLDKYTKNGTTYRHDTLDKVVENGNYIDIYIADEEMHKAWNNVSAINCDGLDKKGQHIKFTLTRYLTAKGLRKDQEGVMKLTVEDIENIEHGYANPIYTKPYLPSTIIYNILWQLDVYKKTNNPNGHSVTQRLEYIRNGLQIIKRNFWFGVGTGDVKEEYLKQYELTNSSLSPEHQLRAHNQFVTMFITFGFLGFVWFIMAISMPILLNLKKLSFLFVLFITPALLSMLNEDTLETQAGVTFFIFYYVLIITNIETKKTDHLPQNI